MTYLIRLQTFDGDEQPVGDRGEEDVAENVDHKAQHDRVVFIGQVARF